MIDLRGDRDRAMIRRGTRRGIFLGTAALFFFMTWDRLSVIRRGSATEAIEIAAADTYEPNVSLPAQAAIFGGACVLLLISVWHLGHVPPMWPESE